MKRKVKQSQSSVGRCEASAEGLTPKKKPALGFFVVAQLNVKVDFKNVGSTCPGNSIYIIGRVEPTFNY